LKRRRVYINLGVFGVIFLVMIIEASRAVVNIGAIQHPYALSAQFSNAFGVLVHSEVDYLGVPVGEVSGSARIPGGVIVHMSIKKSQLIPDGSTATIARKSAIGEQYVEFDPPQGYAGQHGPFYTAGTVVPQDHTGVPLEFSEFLRSASALISSIPPDAVGSLVHEAAVGLNDRTGSLRSLAESGSKLSATFAARTQALDRLITNGTSLTHVFTQHRDSLGQSLSDLRQVAATLAAAQGDTSKLLDQGSAVIQQVADLVANQKGNLDCALKLLNPVLDLTTTPRKLQELRALLDVGPKAFADVVDTIDFEPDGPWIRVGLLANPANPPPQNNPPKTVAPTPAPVSCPPALAPASPDYRPPANSAVFGGPAGPLSPKAGEGLVALSGALLALAVLRRRAALKESAAPVAR
jgi:phospholipid/cholesterol/gamma-HCH transport system substrate-binding protein